jgi:TP53 regulating kinase and related kinases
MEEKIVNGQKYQIIRKLGHGKGGYSYLAKHGSHFVVYKQIHHEPCDYYAFQDKMQAETRDYERLLKIGIPMPKMIDHDLDAEVIIKEYVEGTSVMDLILRNQMKEDYFAQIFAMTKILYPNNTNIDFFPTNFIVNSRDKLIYIDYECNNYLEQWDFEHWGIKYWFYGKPVAKWLEEDQKLKPDLSLVIDDETLRQKIAETLAKYK